MYVIELYFQDQDKDPESAQAYIRSFCFPWDTARHTIDLLTCAFIESINWVSQFLNFNQAH